jgi:lysophospholipase L1-like esterase
VQDLGALPVLCTPVERRHFLDRPPSGAAAGQKDLEQSLEDYPEVVREIGLELGLAVIDLNTWTRGLYLQLGREESASLFCHFEPGSHAHWPDGLTDNTHFSQRGAALVAGHVAAQLQELGLVPGGLVGTTAGRS